MRKSLVVATLVAVAVGVAGCGHATSSGPSSPASSAAPTPSPAPRAARGVRGQITAENGSTWTVTNARGRAFTVVITGQTAFGTKAAPATAAQFPVGAPVRVIGSRNGTTVTAARIATPATGPGASPSASSAPTTPVG